MNQRFKQHSELVNRQIKELFGVYRDAVKDLDVSETEFWIWYTLLGVDGEHTQQDICIKWSLPKQTVNTIMTRMRLKKYVYLEVIPGTRNRKVIRLTEAGRAYGEKMIHPITQAQEKAFAKISPEELEFVNQIIGKYIKIIKGELAAT